MATMKMPCAVGTGSVPQKITLNGTAGGNITPAANAFDGNPSTKAYIAGASGYLTYQFPTAQKVNVFGIRGNTDNPSLSPTAVEIKASNDGGTTWDKLAYGGDFADAEMRYCVAINDTAYTLYRFDCTGRDGGASIGTYAQVSQIEMYYIDGLNFS